MASEPDATGSGQFQGTVSGRGGVFNRPRTSNISAAFNFNVPGLGDVQKQLTGVSDALKELKATLQGMSSAFTSGPIVNMLSEIRQEAAATSASLRDLSGSVSGVSGGGGGRGGTPGAARMHSGNSTSSNAGIATTASASAGAQVAKISGFSGGNGGSFGAQAGAAIGGATGGLASTLVNSIPIIGPMIGAMASASANLMMMPMNFARERIQNNRTQALGMSQELTPYQWSIGGSLGSPDALMRSLSSQFPGQGGGGPGIQGDVSDILNALTVGRRSGAQYGFGANNVQGSRAQGFYQSIAQMQQITPGLGAGQVANVLGAQIGNTQSQQASAFYTGGAFSMIKMGGGQKNISEWSEGILRFLEGQRPGSKRGTKFTYGELLAQNFPGSNVNAWFETVGVSSDMMDYFWSYALGQAASGKQTDIFQDMGGKGGALTGNQAWRRLGSQNVLARNEFGLAGRMGTQYANREQSNQWFNQAMGAMVNRLIPALTGTGGPLAGVQYMPDQLEEFLWNALQSAGPEVQTLVGGLANIGMVSGAMTQALSPNPKVSPGAGTMGDIGDYGMAGATSSAGLNPDLRGKVNRMMRANPNLTINSGLRDTYTQNKLKAKGIGQFGSRHGKSAHYAGEAADIGPSSQYGWLAKNAHKFGLQTAGHKGEPWHVQRAGTMGVGDVGIGDGLIPDWVPGSGIANTAIAIGLTTSNPAGVGGILGGPLNPLNIARDIGGLIDLLSKVFGGVLSSMDAAASVITNLDPAAMFSGKKSLSDSTSTYMSLLTGGTAVSSGSGGGGAWGAAGLGTGVGAGVTVGAQSGAGGGGATLSDIYSRYASGPPASNKAADPATAARIRTALDVASQAGFTGEELVTFVALAGRESHFNPSSYNGNLSTGDNSYGMWQINTLGGMWEKMAPALGLTSKEQLFDPLTNAKAGKYLYDQSKTPFFAWGPYRNDPPLHGGAEQWVAPVYAIAKEAGYIGDPGFGYDGSPGGGLNFNFHNQFQIDASKATSASGSVSIDRLVPLLADKLEAEMKRRLVGTR